MADRWDKRPWPQRAGDALSQLINVVMLNGMPDESVSGRSYRNTVLRQRAGLPVTVAWQFLRAVSEAVFFWEPEHTRLAYEQDLERSRKRAAVLP